MARKKKQPTTGGRPAGATKGRTAPVSLDRMLRQLDHSLVKLLNARAKAARQLALRPPGGGAPQPDAGMDHGALERVLMFNKGPLENQTIRAVFRELFSGTRALIKRLHVVFLGPAYSFSHLAALEKFGSGVELLPIGTIAAAFDAINRGQADYGVVPIENSTDGRIADTLEMFARLPVRICGEIQLRIHHHLLGKCERSAVHEVYSKPQALSQCRTWLARHLPEARTIEMASTATAAQLATEKPGAAAIASWQAGVHYGLNVIAQNIEDNQHNVTRFAIIGNQQHPRSGHDKTSLMFEIPHQPGSLADAMVVFKHSKLNLTWIESFPMAGTPNEYLFFVEFDGHPDDPGVRRALKALERRTQRLEVLGCYPLARAPE